MRGVSTGVIARFVNFGRLSLVFEGYLKSEVVGYLQIFCMSFGNKAQIKE